MKWTCEEPYLEKFENKKSTDRNRWNFWIIVTKGGLKSNKLKLKRAEETTHMDKDSYGQLWTEKFIIIST